MPEEFTLTLGDVKAFVASREPEESVGKPGSRSSCLVACTLAWKYPTATGIDVSSTNTFAYLRDEQDAFRAIELLPVVEQAADKFDTLRWSLYRVTRKELEELMPELFV